MRPSEALAKADREEILRVVERNTARNPRVYGSVLHGTDVEGSDLDILVDRTENTGFVALGELQDDLIDLLGVDVDISTPAMLSKYCREHVLSEARPI